MQEMLSKCTFRFIFGWRLHSDDNIVTSGILQVHLGMLSVPLKRSKGCGSPGWIDHQ